MNGILLKTLLPVVLNALSEPMKGMARQGTLKWYEYAQTTESPLDDIIARFLCDCLNVDINASSANGQSQTSFPAG